MQLACSFPQLLYFPSCGLELSLILATAQEQSFYFRLILINEPVSLKSQAAMLAGSLYPGTVYVMYILTSYWLNEGR